MLLVRTRYSNFISKLEWDVGKSVRNVGQLAMTTQLDAAVLNGTGKHVLNDFPAFIVFRCFVLRLGWRCLSRWALTLVRF